MAETPRKGQNMSLPNLPPQGADPWFNQRQAFDEGVRDLLEPTGDRVFKEDGTLPAKAEAQVQNLIDQRAATVVAAGRPDIASTTPYTQSQLNAIPSGTVYRSTDGPQGAWEWTKRGSSWVCTSGDTGARDVRPLLTNSTAARFRLHRVDGMVQVNYQTVVPDEGYAGGSSFILLPNGYRPVTRIDIRVPTNAEGTTIPYFVLENGAFGQWGPDYTTPTQGVLQWPTVQNWPTTLPGAV